MFGKIKKPSPVRKRLLPATALQLNCTMKTSGMKRKEDPKLSKFIYTN